MADFYIKRGDTREAIRCVLKDSSGAAVDLTGAAVRFLMRRAGCAPRVTAAADVIEPATGGTVTYQWQTGDTDRAGDFDAEWEVTFGDGSKATFPSDGYLSISIGVDLG